MWVISGNDFVYNDDFHDNLKNYQDKINHSIKKNGESERRFHTKWLNMMYPRLRLVRNLLKEDGVTFISIDHNEMVNLVKIWDEIFSADNRLGIISVVNNMKGRSDSAFFAICNEYLICYAKNKDLCSIKGLELSNDELDNDYKLKDEISEYKLVGKLVLIGKEKTGHLCIILFYIKMVNLILLQAMNIKKFIISKLDFLMIIMLKI